MKSKKAIFKDFSNRNLLHKEICWCCSTIVQKLDHEFRFIYEHTSMLEYERNKDYVNMLRSGHIR